MPIARFSVVAPRLSLTSELSDIKSGIRKARSRPKPLEVDPDVLSFFSERLEGNWGRLYDSLPAFFSDLVSGRWEGSETQSVPSGLLGDFGELVGCSIFRSTCPGSTRVARVLRPTGFERPDFLVLDTAAQQLTALECKARAENAARLLFKASHGHLQLNLCSGMQDRRKDGEKQIAPKVVLRQRALADPRIVGLSVAKLGSARIIANQSAIVTPLFMDGRARVMLRNSSVSKPLKCGFNCLTCLSPNGGVPSLLCPIFINNRDIVEPLPPDGMNVERFHSAYRQAGESLWARSSSLFSRSWRSLVVQVSQAGTFTKQPGRYILPLLDVFASALELDVVGDPRSEFSLLEKLFFGTPMYEDVQMGLADALSAHGLLEENPGQTDDPPTVGLIEENQEEVREGDGRYEDVQDVDQGTDRQSVSRTSKPQPRSSGNPQASSSVPTSGEPVQVWFRRFQGRLRQTPRDSVKSIPLIQDQSGSSFSRFLRENSRAERVSELRLPDRTSVSIMRPPVQTNGRIELRLAGRSPEDVRRAALVLLEVLQTLRSRGGSLKEGQQHIRVDGRSIEQWDTRLIPSNGEDEGDLLSMSHDTSSARLLMGRLP